jgi:glutamate 5-kinase
LTDVEALYTDNPLTNPAAKPILRVDDIDAIMSSINVAGSGSSGMGTGGMVTKVLAARLATAAGVHTVVQSSERPQQILQIIQQQQQTQQAGDTQLVYTQFIAQPAAVLNNRKWWILHGLRSRGVINVDRGAASAISDPQRRASLFAAGITSVEGDFHAQEAVSVHCEGAQIARGLVNYSSNEIRRIMGRSSSSIVEILGYCDDESVVNRENLVPIAAGSS